MQSFPQTLCIADSGHDLNSLFFRFPDQFFRVSLIVPSVLLFQQATRQIQYHEQGKVGLTFQYQIIILKTKRENFVLYIKLVEQSVVLLNKLILQQMNQTQTKSSNSFYPPLPSPKKISPKTSLTGNATRQQPLILRTSSKSKQFKKSSVEKSIKEREIERQLKYAKPNKTESSFQVSVIHSSGNIASAFFANQLQDSQDTIQKDRPYSRQKSFKGNMKRQDVGDKGDVTKPFDILSGVSVGGSYPKRMGIPDKNQQYYVYWKNKAHQYLESNMKLMEDNRKLSKQNEQLKEDMAKLKQNQKRQSDKNMINVQLNQKQLNEEIRKMNLHYINKIQSMQRELKKKQIVIISYEAKLVELNSKIAGDYERIKIMNKMKDQIDQLQREIRSLKGESRNVHSNGYLVGDRSKTGLNESISNRNLYYQQK